MKHSTPLLFADDSPDGSLLFSIDGSTATEVTYRGGFEFAADIPSLFEGTKVTKPVPVMAEGKYAILNPATRQWTWVNITKDDIERYFANTPRDVAINYEHRRGGTAKGWVRLKDTGRVGILKTSQGDKMALFASLELYDQSAADVRAGYFRDVSIELKPVSKEILGLALTATPVMRDLQFYSNDLDLVPIVGDGTVSEPEPDSAPAAESLQDSKPLEEPAFAEPAPDKETPMPEGTAHDKQALLAEALQEFGLTPDDLAALPSIVATAKQAQAQARLVTARDRVKSLAARDDGSVVLAPAGIEAAAQLLVFAQDHAELQFSVDGENRNPEQLLEELFSHLNAVQIFGETAGVEPENLDASAPAATEDAEEVLDSERTAGIVARMKSTLSARAGTF